MCAGCLYWIYFGWTRFLLCQLDYELSALDRSDCRTLSAFDEGEHHQAYLTFLPAHALQILLTNMMPSIDDKVMYEHEASM
jgi:hypothetical protein